MTKKQGFTLIELMISISIIAILTALATFSFSSAQKKGRDSRRAQDIKVLQLAAEQYIMQSGSYPNSTIPPWSVDGQDILKEMPSEPKSGAPGYALATNSTSYCFCATVENPVTGNALDSSCSFSGGTGPYFCAENQQ